MIRNSHKPLKERNIMHIYSRLSRALTSCSVIFLTLITILFTLLPIKLEASPFLNEKEIKWLSHLQEPLKVGFTKIPNQAFLDEDGTPIGFSIDLFNSIESSLNTKLNYVYYNSWNELLKAGKSRDVDIIFSAQKTESRLSYFDFSDAVITQKNVFITRSNDSKLQDVSDYSEMRIAVTLGSAVLEYMEQNYPDAVLIPVKTELEALLMVSNGKADAATSETVRAAKYIEQYDISNLLVSADVGYNYQLRVANRNDLPILSIILNKAIDSIPVEQKKVLQLKWGYIKDKEIDKQTLIEIVITIGLLLLFSLLLFYMNQNLKKEITKRTKTEEVLNKTIDKLAQNESNLSIAKSDAESANQAKSMFLSNMSHELRTPLNSVLGFSQLLISDTEDPLTPAQLESVSYIASSGEHLLNLINDVLDLSKIESGTTEVKVETINIQSLIDDVYLMIKPQADNSSITIEQNISSDLTLKADYKKLMQVILNITSNAIKYNSENGSVILASNKMSNGKVRISVCDTGKGVPEKSFGALFEPFNRLNQSDSPIEGTGIGLSICKKLVELMDGEVGVFNNVDKGLTFWVEFKQD